jgi:hypothetical protein
MRPGFYLGFGALKMPPFMAAFLMRLVDSFRLSRRDF